MLSESPALLFILNACLSISSMTPIGQVQCMWMLTCLRKTFWVAAFGVPKNFSTIVTLAWTQPPLETIDLWEEQLVRIKGCTSWHDEPLSRTVMDTDVVHILLFEDLNVPHFSGYLF
ncbi:hypothetical protein K438DRAFT_1753363 [Mycena galopus ATCC 62051]|nr:hypothetical protein K438DRAFT_1753363 [Mycena galopus ATCC 62051]